MRVFRVLTLMVLSAATCAAAQAQSPPRRIALVVGEGAYTGAKLPTAVNDAGLIAQALNDSGFEIVEGRDLDLSGLHQVVRDFLGKVEQSGPDTEAAIYFSGYAAQLEGDNFLLPVDARIGRASDLGVSGFRLSDILRSLNAATKGVKIVIVDAPRGFPALQGKDVASGLALVNAPHGMLVAYATAPGYVVPEGRSFSSRDTADSNYGLYATALADQIYQPGMEADEVFKRLRLQMHSVSAGMQIPWHSYALAQPFYFMAAQGDAALPPQRPERAASPEDAYGIAIESDTIQGYQTFLRLYPDHSLARRIKILLANRREAVVWNRTVARGTAEAYWSYLKLYRRGPHAEEARHRLALLSRPIAPPPNFSVVIYDDVPPPIEIERRYETTYIYNDYRDYYNYPPPPPPPAYAMPPFRRIPWAPPHVVEEHRGFLPVPSRPAMLPPPVWRDRPPPPRVAPIMPAMSRPHPGEVLPGRPGAAVPPGLPRPRPGEALPGGPGAAVPPGLPRPHPGEVLPGRPGAAVPPGLPRPPHAGPVPGGAGQPLPPPNFPDKKQGNMPVNPQGAPGAAIPHPLPDKKEGMVAPVNPPPSAPRPAQLPVLPEKKAMPAPQPQSVPAPQPARQPALPEKKMQPAPQERAHPVERPAPPPVQARPVERPAPPPVQARPVERPAPPPVQARPVERPAPPPVQPRQVERPAPPPVQVRPVERPAPPPVQARPVERPSPPPPPPPQPRQVEQRPAPSSPPPAARPPEPQRQPPPSSGQHPEKKPRPGEQP